jgi:hypothetical protein
MILPPLISHVLLGNVPLESVDNGSYARRGYQRLSVFSTALEWLEQGTNLE